MSTTFGVNVPSLGEAGFHAIARKAVIGNGKTAVFFTNNLAELLPDDVEVVTLDNSNQRIKTMKDLRDAVNNVNQYPFNEGDAYYTIHGSEIVESIWDDVSEELHDKNPDTKY